jgi:hypothetical protein
MRVTPWNGLVVMTAAWEGAATARRSNVVNNDVVRRVSVDGAVGG